MHGSSFSGFANYEANDIFLKIRLTYLAIRCAWRCACFSYWVFDLIDESSTSP